MNFFMKFGMKAEIGILDPKNTSKSLANLKKILHVRFKTYLQL